MEVEKRQALYSTITIKDMREYRKQAGLNQQDLASFVGVRRETISDWERGLYFPSNENLKKLARILKVPASKLEADLRITFAINQLKRLNVSPEQVVHLMAS